MGKAPAAPAEQEDGDGRENGDADPHRLEPGPAVAPRRLQAQERPHLVRLDLRPGPSDAQHVVIGPVESEVPGEHLGAPGVVAQARELRLEGTVQVIEFPDIALEPVAVIGKTVERGDTRVPEKVHEQRTGGIGQQGEQQEPAHGHPF